MTTSATLDRDRLAALLAPSASVSPRAPALARAVRARAPAPLVGGVPMTWMTKWAGGFPLFAGAARGARITDVDGHRYVDFALGDTGAMAGPLAARRRSRRSRARLGDGGITTMLPTEDAAWVGAELTRRFGLPLWSSRSRDRREPLGAAAGPAVHRPAAGPGLRYCYHGSVDETFVTLDGGGRRVPREGNVGPPVDPRRTTRVVRVQRPRRRVERAAGRRRRRRAC